MSHIKNWILMLEDNNPKEIELFLMNERFNKTYENKKYDKLCENTISIIKKAKLIIGESFVAKLTGDKVAIEILMILKAMSKATVTKKTLLELGFKNSSIKLAIKKLFELKILDKAIYEKSGILKLTRKVFRNKKEKFWIIKGEFLIKYFLLYGLTNCLAMLDSMYCWKATKNKQLENSNSKFALVQNNYFLKLNVSRTKIWRAFKALSDFLGICYSKLVLIIRTSEKKFDVFWNKNGQRVKKFVCYEFKTERLLSSEIKKLFLKN
ncbi:integrative conjugal element protein [Mycoplasma cottewii]|uniref:Integrative conjugal element protein n=1 Tax=Mycoplasma cottewii TaxID=51364 RepID=A0ABY5TYZ2_9MOLU|nr:integrative conjugal element protein [Mycoplasma cottewii]UWD34776.1 integrative conjugal element protein [Mycoplasma cottewii]